MLIYGLGGVAGLAGLGTLALFVAARLVGPPAALGVRDGRLAECPPTNNCVSTQSGDAIHAIEPIAFRGGLDEARRQVLEVVGAMPRSTMLEARSDYIHALFRSPTMGFPDDVEFYFDPAAGLIHFRAAARMGSGDMGANRARMESIRAALAPLLQAAK
jgi:uncharacterized protein (DUF1499 family)